MTKRDPKTYVIERADQRRAVTSPIRMEILGQFRSGKASIAEIAERLGRPAASLYYHVGLLEKVGLLRRTGSRPAGKRHEALFEPIAPRIELAVDPDMPEAVDGALRAAGSAFRMAERDMEAALREGCPRQEGSDRNFFAMRMHCRVTRETLAEINEHLNAIYRLVERENESFPPDADEYCSITLALLPLRGRHTTTPPRRSS